MDKNNHIVTIDNQVNIINYSIEDIKNLIYTIRGKQVMLDSDVANLYHYETKKINQAVKRNMGRFPERYCFQLTEEEIKDLKLQIATSSLESLRSQFVTLNNMGRGQHRKYLPYVFTEQGIAMLSGVLRNDIAIQVSINIMDAFVEMRRFLASNGHVFERLTNLEYQLIEQGKELTKHEKQFEKVFDELQRSKIEEFNQKLFFEGQIYDAYSLIIDIIKTAENKILIIDNYIDDNILKMLSKKNKNVDVIIVTSQNSNLIKLDIHKFNKQYPTLKIIKTNKFHDRFILIDNTKLYHIGASLKDLGKKCFAISKIKDEDYVEKINQFC